MYKNCNYFHVDPNKQSLFSSIQLVTTVCIHLLFVLHENLVSKDKTKVLLSFNQPYNLFSLVSYIPFAMSVHCQLLDALPSFLREPSVYSRDQHVACRCEKVVLRTTKCHQKQLVFLAGSKCDTDNLCDSHLSISV